MIETTGARQGMAKDDQIEISETLSLTCILKFVCVRSLESLEKNMEVRSFLSLLPF